LMKGRAADVGKRKEGLTCSQRKKRKQMFNLAQKMFCSLRAHDAPKRQGSRNSGERR